MNDERWGFSSLLGVGVDIERLGEGGDGGCGLFNGVLDGLLPELG